MAELTQQQKRIEAAVWADLERLVAAVRDPKLSGSSKGMLIRLDSMSENGPELYFEQDDGSPEDFDGVELARLLDLLSKTSTLDWRIRSGFVRVFSPSWQPDAIPF